MVAAWLAGGSVGLLGCPLRHALTWLSLSVAVLAGLAPAQRTARNWIVLAAGLALGLFFTSFSSPAVNVLAVAVVLAAVAQIGRGLAGRAALLAAFAAFALGVFRLACDSIPTAWSAADAAGGALGRLAGWLSGCRFDVGASFAGLDFLVVAAAVYAGWIVSTARATGLASATGRRATGSAGATLAAVAALAGGQLAYLLLVANSQRLLSLLPPAAPPVLSGASHIGAWSWADGLRTLVCWNLPLAALLIHGTLVAILVRSGWWLPAAVSDAENLARRRKWEEMKELSGGAILRDMIFHFGPIVVAVAAALLTTLSVGSFDLHGKTIVAYDDAAVDWRKPEYDSADDGRYGMLPILVRSLGGRFAQSKRLSPADLAAADALLVIQPDRPLPQNVLDRVRNYVHGGGSLLLAAETAAGDASAHRGSNGLLQPATLSVHFDGTVTRPIDCEQACETLPHPTTAGFDGRQGCYGLGGKSSIRAAWPARPVIVGRWGASDPTGNASEGSSKAANPKSPSLETPESPAAGRRLGDFVLAAEQPFGGGRIFMLADAAPLENDMLPDSYPLVGRLLGYLANRGSSPQDDWRQAAALAALAALAVLIVSRPAAWQVMLSASALALTLVCSAAAADWAAGVLPDGRHDQRDFGISGFRDSGASDSKSLNLQIPKSLDHPLAYIDASHLDAYSSDSRSPLGLAGLKRMLMRHGLLPLSAPDLAPERLGRAGLLIVIGPARGFSAVEREAVKQFVRDGGTLLCMVGALDAPGSETLLADFDFRVPYSPVPPGDAAVEPWPLGACTGMFNEGTWQAPFYAAWPVECRGSGQQLVFEEKSKAPIVVSCAEGQGVAVVIGDTHFAANANHLKGRDMAPFWRWLLSRILSGQQPWQPSAATAGNAKAQNGDEDDDDGGDEDEQPSGRQPGAEGNR
jgi:hypothetical protein